MELWIRSIMTTMRASAEHTHARHRVFWQQPMIAKDGEKKVGDARKVLRPHCPRRGAVEHCQPELKDLFSSYFPTFGRLQCVP